MGLGLLGGVIPTFLLAKGVPQVGAGMSTILCSSELPVALLASALILAEKSTLLQWCGVVLIILGISTPYISLLRHQHRV
ncbi:membrane protein [Desulforamulus reducens MI-1]|uniref:Membrane protein n=1 Tax=Desulforamulus reducens (strain ATCC BAA-1160 / DSM 100696 / MI-1) TaxID=349161 RepID=A4J1G1_DESRM|nr:membrane protein [Desulforamulus reducens MI-1]